MRAVQETLDREGRRRVAGEEWLVDRVGAYLPGVYEELVEKLQACILTDKAAVHIRAKQTFTNKEGKKVKSGEEYLITSDQMDSFIPDVYEEVVGMVGITTLTNRQYCVILNPVGTESGPQLGARRLVKGEKSFFLQPGESLENGIQDIHVLSDNEGLLLRASQAFQDSLPEPRVERQPGDQWLLQGPAEYIPPVEVTILTKRKAIPLHENEGIYVRSSRTGQVCCFSSNNQLFLTVHGSGASGDGADLHAGGGRGAVGEAVAGDRADAAERGPRYGCRPRGLGQPDQGEEAAGGERRRLLGRQQGRHFPGKP